jgi:4-diphosphocytidyl-2-C-methyl-D-erythritol kinase
MPIHERARAKVNLTLTVRGRRSDGYHDLESLVTFAAIHDTVTLDANATDALVVSGPFAQAIEGENLVGRALALLRATDRSLRLGALHLQKRLPVAAGLGGGSADVAALLRAVRRANPERTSDFPWAKIAAQLGSDIPVCLTDRPALVWGRGECVAPVRSLPPLNAVTVNPRLPLSTAAVFAAARCGPASSTQAAPTLPELAGLPELIDYMQARGNDLEPAAADLLPTIAEIKSLLAAQADCRFVAMSGSGPTCFAIFSGPGTARGAAAGVAAAKPGWWVECTTLAGTANDLR